LTSALDSREAPVLVRWLLSVLILSPSRSVVRLPEALRPSPVVTVVFLRVVSPLVVRVEVTLPPPWKSRLVVPSWRS
jgi:hypothetical protein